MPKLKIIASGTFDRLHEGHKYFLRKAFKIGFPFIAITADEMLGEKEFSELIHPYKKRRSELVKYLRRLGYKWRKDYKILKIKDRFGFAIDLEDLDAILISSETRDNAEEINRIRKKKGFHPLLIFEIPLLEDEKGKISSTRRREEEMRKLR